MEPTHPPLLSKPGQPALLTLVIVALTSAAAHAELSFTDQTQASGLIYTFAATDPTDGIPMHAGMTPGDFDNDGWMDLYIPSGGDSPAALFINNQDGTFSNRAGFAGLEETFRGNGTNAVDYDNDGHMDIFVANFGDTPGSQTNGQHRLYRNNGDGTFTDVADAAGVQSTGDYPDGYGVAWGDYNMDGCLDLVVGGWHKPPPPGEPFAFNNKLFENNCDGTFTDVTDAAGLFVVNTQGFGSILVDTNQDRYPELLVAGDFGTSKYYSNNRDGTFTSLDIWQPGLKAHNGMGNTTGDFDRNGLPDWYITSIVGSWNCEGPSGNFLYLNQGDDVFEAVPESGGVTEGRWGWGTAAEDFNHDGWLDIAATNGWFNSPDPCTGEEWVNQPSTLYISNGMAGGELTFTEMAQEVGLVHTFQGRSLVTFDYDNDGDMDIVIGSSPIEGPGEGQGTGEYRLYRNETVGSGADFNWLEVHLDSSGNPALPPHGWGAAVELRRDALRQYRRITAGSNYLSRSQLVAHFGLGSTDAVDLVIEWPDGFRTLVTDVAANQAITVTAEKPYDHGDLVRGETLQMTVNGLGPGEKAFFMYSVQGPGEGPCFEAAGGLCLDLLSPMPLGTKIADGAGTAVFQLAVPLNAPDGTFYTQVAVLRGQGGKASLKSNVVEADVVDP